MLLEKKCFLSREQYNYIDTVAMIEIVNMKTEKTNWIFN